MRRRALHWLVLGFTTLWFGVLVPVHNRGEITLPGSGTFQADRTGHACCAATPGPKRAEPCHAPAPARGGTCAVCSFIAALDAPPPFTWVETRLGLAGTVDASRPDDPPAARRALPFHSRAPPAA
jgi:hypothetical protein